MALIELKTDPTPRELRQFGCLWLPLFCSVAGYLAWTKLGATFLAGSLWGAGVASALVGAVRPRLIRHVFVGLIHLTAPIGWVVSHLMLVLLYYGVVTPIGLLLRLVGRDPMARGFEKEAPTYWRAAAREESIESYLRQY